MSQAHLIPTADPIPTFPAIAYKGTPVLTTEMLAHAYGVNSKQIRQNFNNNRERFSEGKHCYMLSGSELKEFRLCVEIIDAQISTKVRTLTLWTDRGSARHAKMLESDKAWDVYEMLEDTFFATPTLDKLAAEERAQLPANVNPQSLTPAQQAQIHAIVAAKVGMLPRETQRKAYAEIWSRFGRHFQVAKYQQLPPARMGEAVEYLVDMELKAAQKALPPAKHQHLFDRLGLTDWEKVQMGPHIRRMAEDERELGPKTVECILLKARYIRAIEDVHRLGNTLFTDLGKAEKGVTKVVHQAVNKTGTFSDPFFDTLYDDKYRLVKIAGDFFDTAFRALNSRICLARMMGL